MKEIDKYLKLLYRHLKATDQEIADLQVEMKSHLLDSVHELQAEGKSPQESVRIAIERFGDPGQLSRELPKIFIMSRRRFSWIFLAVSGIILAVTVALTISYFNNQQKKCELAQVELAKQAIIQELQQTRKSFQDYVRIFEQTNKLASVFQSSEQLSVALNAKYNKAVIDEIGEMNKTFKYHNAVLMAVAVIAADTDYECLYFKDIAELGVMKLSESAAVVNLAQKARDAKLQDDKDYVENQIRLMKTGADFMTYQEALEYNKRFIGP